MKILILALSGIGDALMFTPALNFLKRATPAAQIDALVMINGVRDMYENNSNINKVIFFDFLKEGFLSSLKFVSSLRGNYDITLNVYPSNRKEYNLISFLIGAEKRAGVKYLRKDKPNLGFLNNIRITENDALHNVQTNIKLVEKIFEIKAEDEPALEFPVSDSDRSYAAQYLNNISIADKDYVVGFHPGCATLKNHIKRRWEPEKFAALAKHLIEKDKAKILIFGGPEEEDLKENIAGLINSENAYVVKTKNLTTSAAVMNRCDIFVTNDSSLMHIASALGLNVVVIIGPTSRFYIHPWKTDYRIVSLNLSCSPCFFYSPKPLMCYRDDVHFKCVKEINFDMVYGAVKDMIQKKNISAC